MYSKQWQQEAISARMTCGNLMEVGGGQGSGKGALFMSSFELGQMLRIAGDVSLLVLADRKQLLHLHIIGLAANYRIGTAKIIKMEIDCVGETSIIKEVNEIIPFSQTFNIILQE